MLFLLAFSLGVPAQAATWHVAQQQSNASDANSGTAKAPWKTITQAAKKVGPGDRVEIATGIYRELVTIETSGLPDNPICFQAAVGAHVVVSGADLLDPREFSREAGPEADQIYATPWSHKWGTHPNNDYHRLIGRCEQVIVDGYLLHQVLEKSQLSRGAFYVDMANKRLFVWDRANLDLIKGRSQIEASTRSTIWTMAGSYLHTRGIIFRYAANSAQHGAVSLKGAHCLLEDCTVERTNGAGLHIAGENAIVCRCRMRDNGQLGFAGVHAHRLLFTACEVRNNNVKGFARGWEAGGDKICLSRDVVLEKSIFADNRGSGIWFDIGNETPTVRNCLILNNEGGGIFYEISCGLHAHDNVILGNGFEAGAGPWGGDGAIALSSSPGCIIERNLMVGNREGFQFREQWRNTPRIGHPRKAPEEPVWNHDQIIRNNAVAYNDKWQIGGWFDVPDHRFLPLAMKRQLPAQEAKVSASKGRAKDAHDQPQNLSLESLNIRFQSNIYARNPGEGLVLWGAAWQRGNRPYSAVGPWRSEMKIDEGSLEEPVVFADLTKLDLRLAADSPAIKMGCYPKGEVPGVVLGVYSESAVSMLRKSGANHESDLRCEDRHAIARIEIGARGRKR
jgi:hypothetical protein